jgi:uncharacterized protein YggE
MKNFKKRFGVLAAASVVASGLIAGNAFAQTATCCNQPTPTTMYISTSAEIKQAPDLAIVSGGVVTQAKDAKTAMAENSRLMNAAVAAVKATGIADKDIQTSGINIEPQYVYVTNKPPIIKGYQVSNTVTVRIHDMAKVGPVLDSMVEKGMNNVSGPNFTIDDPDKALDGARVEAMKKALSRAELYAKTAGLKIKRITSINESGGYTPQPYAAAPVMAKMSIRADEAAPVQAGEVSMSININVGFELEK